MILEHKIYLTNNSRINYDMLYNLIESFSSIEGVLIEDKWNSLQRTFNNDFRNNNNHYKYNTDQIKEKRDEEKRLRDCINLTKPSQKNQTHSDGLNLNELKRKRDDSSEENEHQNIQNQSNESPIQDAD